MATAHIPGYRGGPVCAHVHDEGDAAGQAAAMADEIGHLRGQPLLVFLALMRAAIAPTRPVGGTGIALV